MATERQPDAECDRTLDHIRRRLQEALPHLRAQYRVQGLMVFGSYARGEQTPRSDLDLVVDFAEVPSLFTFLRLQNHLTDLLELRVDPVMRSALKPHIRDRVLREAVRL